MEIKITNQTIGRWILIYIPTLIFGISVYKYGIFSIKDEDDLVGIFQVLYCLLELVSVGFLGLELLFGNIKFNYTIKLPKFGPEPFDESHEDWDDYQDFLRNRD